MPSCPYVNWSGISSWPDSRFQVARPTFSSASYEAPFDRCDRVQDYRVAWGFLEGEVGG